MSVVQVVASTARSLLSDLHRQVKAELAGLEPGKKTKEAEMMLLQKYGVILPQVEVDEGAPNP